MNKNTQRSSPVLMNAIMEGVDEKKRISACALVMAALEDRDLEINRVWKENENIKAKYNAIVSEIDNIKSWKKVE